MYILYYMTKVKIRVAIAAPFFSWFFLPNKKCPYSPTGNKDRKYNFCGTTLLAGRPATRPGANTPAAP